MVYKTDKEWSVGTAAAVMYGRVSVPLISHLTLTFIIKVLVPKRLVRRACFIVPRSNCLLVSSCGVGPRSAYGMFKAHESLRSHSSHTLCGDIFQPQSQETR